MRILIVRCERREESPMAKIEIKEIMQQIIGEASVRKASDCYIYPRKFGYEISYRVHQKKIVAQQLGFTTGEKLILLFKYLAGMDVSERRKVQIGAASFQYQSGVCRIRLSSVSDYRNHEILVLRFLHSASQTERLQFLFPNQMIKVAEKVRAHGLYLFCGPTGAGKSTTMHHLAQKYSDRQIITIEDPVELEQETFLQLQVNDKIGLTYEKLVKVCLRSRPDLLIIGEIRDAETAKIAIRGALTGHLIFSTLHAMHAHGAIPRLKELGVPKEELRQCLKGVIYQRLIPLVCSRCGEKCQPFCPYLSRNHAVLFDTLFFEEVFKKNETGARWKRLLGKAWARGQITQKTFQNELLYEN